MCYTASQKSEGELVEEYGEDTPQSWKEWIVLLIRSTIWAALVASIVGFAGFAPGLLIWNPLPTREVTKAPTDFVMGELQLSPMNLTESGITLFSGITLSHDVRTNSALKLTPILISDQRVRRETLKGTELHSLWFPNSMGSIRLTFIIVAAFLCLGYGIFLIASFGCCKLEEYAALLFLCALVALGSFAYLLYEVRWAPLKVPHLIIAEKTVDDSEMQPITVLKELGIGYGKPDTIDSRPTMVIIPVFLSTDEFNRSVQKLDGESVKAWIVPCVYALQQ